MTSSTRGDTPASAFKSTFFGIPQIREHDPECAAHTPEIESANMTFILAVSPEEDIIWSGDVDMAKTTVMQESARLVRSGDAVVVTLESGTLELRFAIGAIFHLGEDSVTRIA
jgi:hypothetical protein